VDSAPRESSWPGLFSTLLAGSSLSADETAWAMTQIMSGDATPAQIGGFAIALRSKGETTEELIGLVRAMLAHAAPLLLDGPMVDTCGTGGDRAATVNISTMAALVVRGAGVRVVKHGNRAASSACGSADLLEELGVKVDLPPDGVRRCVGEIGIGFCFAPVFHPAFRHTGPPRRELGVATVFNFLGPLTNPAQPSAQAVGVADERMAGVMAGVLAARGASALVFRGTDGLDELSVAAPSRVWVVADGQVREDSVDPAGLGIDPAAPDALRGADSAHNAGVARRMLDGERGAIRNAVLLNAAAALVAVEGPTGDPIAGQLGAALPRAAESLDSGAAGTALQGWIEASQAAATLGG
jgi:anthranilate phosphoribosyltransferase